MTVRVRTSSDGYAIDGQWEGCAAANAFLKHLAGRGFSAATVRAYAFDVLNLARFLLDHDLRLAVTPVTVFEWIDWQDVRREPRPSTARRKGRGTAASTINRQVAAVRALFEYLVMTGMRTDNPVPSPRRGQGLRPQARGLLGHLRPLRGDQRRALPEGARHIQSQVEFLLTGVGLAAGKLHQRCQLAVGAGRTDMLDNCPATALLDRDLHRRGSRCGPNLANVRRHPLDPTDRLVPQIATRRPATSRNISRTRKSPSTCASQV